MHGRRDLNLTSTTITARPEKTSSSFLTSRVTVFCYHRVGIADEGFCGYRPNFSATPSHFRRQMQLIKHHFTPVSVQQLINAIEDSRSLPPRPALVTFDDGYRDNGTVAWPIMRDLQIPGVIFLATNHIGGSIPFLWDFVAYCFEQTAFGSAAENEVEIPLLGRVRLSSMSDRQRLTAAWITESKKRPSKRRWPAAHSLASALDVYPPETAFSDLYLTWDEVKSLAAEGMEFGGHTRSHPILSQTSPEEAWEEIVGCQEALTQALGRPATSFAYPNGSSADFLADHEKMVLSAGFRIAFSLAAGSSSLNSIAVRPTAVKRLYVAQNDGFLRLAFKLALHTLRPS